MAGGLQDIALQPGVNAQLTLAQNTAGISVSNLIRFKGSLVQKLGGWTPYFPFSLSCSPIRDLIAFEGLLERPFVVFGSATRLGVVSGAGLTSASLLDITPQFFQSSPTPSFSVTSGSQFVTVTDPGSSMGLYGAIRLDTPVSLVSSVGSSIGSLVLSGIYPIKDIIDVNTYRITASAPSPATVSSGGILPAFYVTAGSAVVDVLFSGNAYISQLGLYYPFRAPTTVLPSQIIQGAYQINNILDSTHFQIGSPVPSTGTLSSAAAVPMNGGLASIYHYAVIGPAAQTAGVYGIGVYSSGLYGTGPTVIQAPATPITALDWTLDQWGSGYVIACPKDDAIYFWAPTLAISTAQPMAQGGAPSFNRGVFIAIPIEIVMAYGSCQVTGVQDLLQIRWSDSGAQQGFNNWTATPNSFAGGFRLANGSAIRCGIHSPQYEVFFTDVDCWTATYIGQPLVFSFQPAGYGCGALGPHCAGFMSNVVYWASQNNFFMLTGGTVQVLPCTVWDFFFQQLDTANQQKVRCAINSLFNEVAWFFPVIGGNGENQAYVKLHIGEGNEYEWDYGFLERTAWVNVTGVGFPLGTDEHQMLMQHEVAADAAGTALAAAFETGYFEIGDGTNLAFVDWILPDAKWSVVAGTPGTLLFTFFTADYAGQVERMYGPYPVTQGIPYINTRIRGRFFRVRVESQDLGSFWRVGRIKFRWAPCGKR